MPTFRIKEAASLLGVSNDTLYRWIEAGRITAADDASGVLAVDGVALATLAQELAKSSLKKRDGSSGNDLGFRWLVVLFRAWGSCLAGCAFPDGC
jgi:excisionase family DNA binding protein